MSEKGFDRAIPKRKYRERHQPADRQNLGYLEKHRDYSQRAKDFHAKEAELNALREQAYTRNPEEFYFKMVHSQLKDGIHTEFEPPVEDQVQKKRKTHDVNVLLMRTQSQNSRLARLRSGLHLLDQPLCNSHVVFVKDEAELEAFDPAAHFDTHPALLHTKNRLTMEQLQTQDLPDHSEHSEDDYEQFKETAGTADVLDQLLKEVEKDKQLLSKEKRKLIDPDTRLYKFFRERKR
jgi:U3 small nucleolar RNA-associated protein 11